ncbi:MAG: hypothetical protein AB2A00_23885 [Myxococcota bacterium]
MSSISAGILGGVIATLVVQAFRRGKAEPPARDVPDGREVHFPRSNVIAVTALAVAAWLSAIACTGLALAEVSRSMPAAFATAFLGFILAIGAVEQRRRVVFDDEGMRAFSPWSKDPVSIRWDEVTKASRGLLGGGNITLASGRKTISINPTMHGAWELVGKVLAKVRPEVITQQLKDEANARGVSAPPPPPRKDAESADGRGVAGPGGVSVAGPSLAVTASPTAGMDGARVVGLLLVANSLLNVLGLSVGGAGDHPLRINPASVLIDAALGAALLRGNRGVVPLVALRAVIGTVLYASLHLAANDVVSLVLQTCFGVAATALLWLKRPTLVRAAASLAGVVLLSDLLAEVAPVTRFHPAARLQYWLDGARAAPDAVEGVDVTWRLTSPPGWWQLSRAETTRLNSDADAHLSHPDLDVHLIVIPEETEAEVELDKYMNWVRTSLTNESWLKGVDDLGTETLPKGKLVRVRGVSRATKLEYLVYVTTWPGGAAQVMAWGAPSHLRRVETELRNTFNSFTPPAP